MFEEFRNVEVFSGQNVFYRLIVRLTDWVNWCQESKKLSSLSRVEIVEQSFRPPFPIPRFDPLSRLFSCISFFLFRQQREGQREMMVWRVGGPKYFFQPLPLALLALSILPHVLCILSGKYTLVARVHLKILHTLHFRGLVAAAAAVVSLFLYFSHIPAS